MFDFNVNPNDIKLSYNDYLDKINKIILKNNLKIKQKYQVVIMAAGKGSRMNLNYPKPLFKLNYPYGVNSLIGNILFTLEKNKQFISSINIVINKNDKDFFKNLKFNHDKLNLILLDQKKIKGTGSCLYESYSFLNKDQDIILLWGDLAIFPNYMLKKSIIIKENTESDIVFPTRIRKDPYVSFIRNNYGYIDKVLHSNEGEKYKGYAEQDCSCFIINSNFYYDFKKFIESKQSKLKLEIDFIHYIPYSTSKGNNVIGLPIGSDNFISGINTRKKTKDIQKILDSFNLDDYIKFFL